MFFVTVFIVTQHFLTNFHKSERAFILSKIKESYKFDLMNNFYMAPITENSRHYKILTIIKCLVVLNFFDTIFKKS